MLFHTKAAYTNTDGSDTCNSGYPSDGFIYQDRRIRWQYGQLKPLTPIQKAALLALVTSTEQEMVKPNSTDFYECVVQALRVSLHYININACEINAEGFFTYRCNVFGKIPHVDECNDGLRRRLPVSIWTNVRVTLAIPMPLVKTVFSDLPNSESGICVLGS